MLMTDVSAHRAALNKLFWLAVALGAIPYCRHYWDEAPGLTLYVDAARCLLDGLALQSCDASYTYPPIFALVTIPLVPLPRVLQNLAWYALTLGSLIGCFTQGARLARRLVPDDWSERDLAWLYGLGILLSLKFVFAAIGNQSYDAFVVLLVLYGLAGIAEDRSGWTSAWAGVSFACAAALKATPLLFLPYLVIKRHYVAAAVMTIVLAFASVLPDLVFTVGRTSGDTYLAAWLHQVAQPALTEKLDGNLHTFWFATNPNNNSLRGLVGLFVDDHSAPANFKIAMYSVYAIYCAFVALLILRTRDARAAAAIDGALLLISMLLLSPMSSQTHYVALIPAILAVVAIWRKGDPAMRKLAGALVIAHLALTNATSKDLVGGAVTFWAKEHRLLVSDALLFVMFFAVLVFRLQPSGAKSGAPSVVEQTPA
jgi:alpha-1,2-mannosyltransferase